MSTDAELRRDSNWFLDNYDSIQHQYSGMAIAIVNEEVIYAESDYEKFLEHIRQLGYDPTEIIIETIPDEDAAYIL